MQGSWVHIETEDFELRQLAWTTVTQLLQHRTRDSSSQACTFIRSASQRCCVLCCAALCWASSAQVCLSVLLFNVHVHYLVFVVSLPVYLCTVCILCPKQVYSSCSRMVCGQYVQDTPALHCQTAAVYKQAFKIVDVLMNMAMQGGAAVCATGGRCSSCIALDQASDGHAVPAGTQDAVHSHSCLP